MKKCSKCKKEKFENEFNYKDKERGLRQVQCKDCTRLLIKNHYNKNKQYYLSKAKKRNKDLRDKVNLFIYEYLSKNPCVDCGEGDVAVLEFDHKAELGKLKAVSGLIRDRSSLSRLQQEISKCDVRCANCHRRKTSRDFNWFKSIKHP